MHMGKLFGRASLAAKMRELGYELAKLLLEEMDMRYITV